MEKKSLIFGLALTFLVLSIHLITIDNYGLTWDFHHHFFAGLKLWNHPITPDLTTYLPFSEPDPRNTSKLPFGPIMSMAPVATYILFFEKLGLLAFDNAYNISIIFTGVLGLFFFYLFLLEAKGQKAAIIGFLFLALYPRWWGDLHNNMKDVPQAAAFTLAIWLFWRLFTYKRIKDLLFASIAFAIAFNTKINTLTVPIIGFLWVFSHIFLVFFQKQKKLQKLIHLYRFPLLYFITAPIAAFILWWFFWPSDPIGQLLYIPQFFRDNTINIEVLLAGAWYCSGMNVPWYYPLYYLGIVTPLPILFFFLVGIATIFIQIFRMTFKIQNSKIKALPSTMNHELSTNLLFVLWFFIPIARYILPSMGVIDGIRHFEEIVFPLTAISMVGVMEMYNYFTRFKNKHSISFMPIIIIIGSIIWLIASIIRFHPYQISYFNELVGGLKGAFGKYDLDYWGSSQKEAITWLNEHAPHNSRIHIVMAADVFGKYLRPDLRVNLNGTGYDASNYVVVLNRQGFFYRYFWLWEYFLRREPIHTINVQGVALTWIFDNSQGQIPRKSEWWTGIDPCIRKYW